MHHENCEAPICSHDPHQSKKVTWYPGEPVCGHSPMQKFQRIQRRINRKVEKGTFKNPNTQFTMAMLSRMTKVMDGSKGRNPENAIATYNAQHS